jgi:predicted aconitase with swiveling domain
MSPVLKGRGVVPGRAEGRALVSRQAISGWSGLDEKTGLVIEKGHPFEGRSIKDRILVLSGGKGSNGWSIHFHAAKVRNIGPAGLILPRLDSRLAVTVAVLGLPTITDLEGDPFELIPMDSLVEIDADRGLVTIMAE